MVLVEADSTHGSNGAVLATPVGGVIEVTFLQDVVGTSVIGLLVNHPTMEKLDQNEHYSLFSQIE